MFYLFLSYFGFISASLERFGPLNIALRMVKCEYLIPLFLFRKLALNNVVSRDGSALK